MDDFRQFLLILISFAMGAALATSLMTVLPWLHATSAIAGLILAALLAPISSSDSWKDSNDTGSGCGTKEK